MTFTYSEFTTRNIGFVTEAEQQMLKQACVFVCGTGGMGGAAIQSIIRAGVGNLILADLDSFETSNLNRQVFANLDHLDRDKAEATRAQCLNINPDANIDVYDQTWTQSATELVSKADVIINGTDDLAATLLLYRTSRELGRAVIDAYASPLPSIYVTRPGRPMPEERLGYPTIGTDWNALTKDQCDASFFAEAVYVMLNSSSRHHIDLDLAADVAAGRRSRMSFAPMVISTGTLMAYETLGLLLGRTSNTDENGWFLNPYTARIERPLPRLLSGMLRPFVRRKLTGMVEAADG